MKLDEAIEIIADDVSDTSLRTACIRLTRYLYVHHAHINHLTFTRLGELMELNDTEKLLKATQYLCGVRVELLSIRFELIDGNETYEISNSALAEARKTNILIHPETGYPVTNFEPIVFPFFVPGASISEDKL